MKQGVLIVIDGTDGSGKTTQIKLLSDYLSEKNIPHETISFPRYGNNKYTEQVEKYLKGEQKFDALTIAKAYAEDRQLAKPMIEEWLKEGKIVIANRYTAANIAHLGIDLKEDMPKPLLSIILDVDPKIGQKNVLGKPHPDIHEKNLQHLQSARAVYLKLASQNNWVVINCMQGSEMKSPEQIHQEIVKIINDVLISRS